MSDGTKSTISIGTIILFLIVCVFVYVFYRPESTLINILLGYVMHEPGWLSFKAFIRDVLPLPKWIIFSLPGGLWVFAATMLSKKLKLRLWRVTFSAMWLPMLFALWLEFWQLMGVVKGRFDWMDVLLVILFGLSAILFPEYKMLKSKRNIFFERQRLAFGFVFFSVFMGHVF